MIWYFVPPIAALGGWALWKGYHRSGPLRGEPAPAPPPAPPLLGKPPSQTIPTAPTPVSADGPMAPPKPNPIKTPAGNPLILITPLAPNGKATQAALVATVSPNRTAAHLLYDTLKAKGTGDPAGLRDLVLAFQAGHNADTVARGLVPLALTGLYDQPTSSALTIYTGQPIPPAPSTPAPPPPPPGDFTKPGPAAQSSSNLYAYLKTHKNVRTDPTLSALVKAFQHDVNTDPQFPGPVYQFPNLKIIKTKLTEDGIYGKGTSDALAVVTFERINP